MKHVADLMRVWVVEIKRSPPYTGWFVAHWGSGPGPSSLAVFYCRGSAWRAQRVLRAGDGRTTFTTRVRPMWLEAKAPPR
jgi:hypothetical protein